MPRLFRTLVLSMPLLLSACSGADPLAGALDLDVRAAKKPSCPAVPAKTTRLVVSPATWSPLVGGRITFTASTADGVAVANCALSWTTTDSTAVSISSDGTATALVAGGLVTITAQTGGKVPARGTAAVAVSSPVARIEVQHYGVYVNGDTGTFSFRALNAEGATLQGATFTITADPSLVSIDARPCGQYGCLQRLATVVAGPLLEAIDTQIRVGTPGSTATGLYRVKILPSALDSLRALTFGEAFGGSPRSVSTYPVLSARVGDYVGFWPVVFWGSGTRSQSVSNAEYEVVEGSATIVRARGGWGDNVAQADYANVVPAASGTLKIRVRFRRSDGSWMEQVREISVLAP
ncbi:MAG: hypothetical protein P3C10_14320 [Gemmatimonadota bacterium]|nr:hypothetical protein [Gemmatimonadota bacterium]